MGITFTRPETLVQEALAPEKMAEAQHTVMCTRTRSPCPALALQNAPQTDAIHEDCARAFQKEKTSCQGRPMKAHALPCLKPLMICTLPRSPYYRVDAGPNAARKRASGTMAQLHNKTQRLGTYPLIPHREFPTVVTD
jgi:hypothetical protein